LEFFHFKNGKAFVLSINVMGKIGQSPDMGVHDYL